MGAAVVGVVLVVVGVAEQVVFPAEQHNMAVSQLSLSRLLHEANVPCTLASKHFLLNSFNFVSKST